ncbi:uncharacterized protein LOC111614033 [Centruroides sculpturatus]|uniref:uncharacterized protein LOC111614033 n=1 Tax=Centruroides sculpturatus TaxID=218467 RepID=UPI000C6E03C2|nr:uncharacterized protein LOC111614033 [Centruroides sculpturatus]
MIPNKQVLIIFIVLANFYLNCCDTDCVQDFFKCLSSNVTIKEFIACTKKCCEETLNETVNDWSDKFHNCVLEDQYPIILSCIDDKDGNECGRMIQNYFNRTQNNYNEFRNQAMSRIKRATMEQCQNNTDVTVKYLCNFYEDYYYSK